MRNPCEAAGKDRASSAASRPPAPKPARLQNGCARQDCAGSPQALRAALRVLCGESLRMALMVKNPLGAHWHDAAWRPADVARAVGISGRLAGCAQAARGGLLPPAIGARSIARLRTIAPRERRFPCDVIARWLDAEGYASPNTAPGHWVRSDVRKLLREGRSAQPATQSDEPKGTPAAWR